jgi:subtilisin family serine protease
MTDRYSPLHARSGATALIAAAMLLIAVLPAAARDGTSRSTGLPLIAGTTHVSAAALQGRAPSMVPARTTDPKLDAVMAGVAQSAARSTARGLQQALAAGVSVDRDRVNVIIDVQDGGLEAARRAIVDNGGESTGDADEGRVIQAWLPPQALRALAKRSEILAIGQPEAFFPVEAPQAGSHMTQGDAALNGAAWRASGKTGAGVRIGIIDVGFQGYPALLGSELPATVTTKNFVDGQTQAQLNGTTVHGAACAEVIHDVAPDAQLFLAKVSSKVDIKEAADWLVNVQHVDIISSSIGIYNITPGDGTGFFQNIINAKRAAGTIWFTAASNDREAHWGGAFHDAGGANAGWHRFAAPSQIVDYFGPHDADHDAYLLNPGYTIYAFLRWNDWHAPVDQDLDLYIVRYNGSQWEIVAGSVTRQDGTAGRKPVEAAGVTTSGGAAPYGIAIFKHHLTTGVNLEMFAPKVTPLDQQVRPRSLSNLADSAAAVTVAALDSSSPYKQEHYSSQGPANGPGGSASGGILKPDISGYANVDTASYGNTAGSLFNGTSAATPHAAGAAALVLQAHPAFTPNQLEAFLKARALDKGAAGADPKFGAGRLFLGAPPP